MGDVIEGVVTKQLPFGSFVESEGFTGLAHEQSWPVGTRVSVRIREMMAVFADIGIACG